MNGGKKIPLTALEKQQLVKQGQEERNEWEFNNLGNFENITDIIPNSEVQSYIDYSN